MGALCRFSCLFYSRGYSVPSPNGGDNKTRDGVAARRSLSAENHFSEAFLAAMHRRRPKTPKSQFTHSATTVFVLCFLPLPLAATKHFWIAGFFFFGVVFYILGKCTHTHTRTGKRAGCCCGRGAGWAEDPRSPLGVWWWWGAGALDFFVFSSLLSRFFFHAPPFLSFLPSHRVGADEFLSISVLI